MNHTDKLFLAIKKRALLFYKRNHILKNKIFIASIVFSISNITYASYEMSSINIPADARPSLNKRLISAELKEQNQNGYLEKTSFKYQYLKDIESNFKYESSGNMKSTLLRKSNTEIVTHSSLKKVPANAKLKTIGFAPLGTFNRDTGWNGITEIFKTETTGTCQFSHLDLKASHGAYSLSEKNERRDVNGKYTYVAVTGQNNVGFDYEIIWFEDLNKYTLNCINKEFSKDFLQNVITLAKKIDLAAVN